MLRPATPLSLLLLVAFVLLLLSVISTPIVKGIKLATHNGIDFGVFGYCKNGKCSGARVGYDTLFTDTTGNEFALPSDTRHSLSSLLIVHPIAALFALILLFLSISAHLHAPSHSPRYLLAMLILTLATLLLSLLAFLVDILLFVPHLQWAGWLVLASTILITASGIVTCAMRRTLVSRKARKKRIAENAEMNGDNFYARQGDPTSPPPLSAQPTAPSMNPPKADTLPSFTTYDASKDSTLRGDSEDQIPLTKPISQRSQERAGGAPFGASGAISDNSPGRYHQGGRGGSGPGRGRGGYGVARDEFGHPLPPSGAFGSPAARRYPSDPRSRQPYGNGMPMDGRGGQYGPRGGRGGYPPNGRGDYARGGPPRRGQTPPGMAPDDMAAGMAAGAMMSGAYRGPPPGYGNGYAGGPRRGGPYREGSPGPQYEQQYGRRPLPGPASNPAYRGPSPGPDPEYGGPSPGAPQGPGYRGPGPNQGQGYAPGYGRQPSPGAPLAAAGALIRRDSPLPNAPMPTHHEEQYVGQAVEMDASTGSPSYPNSGSNQAGPIDTERGIMMENIRPGPMARNAPNPIAASSVYSGAPAAAYVPPRAAWANLDQRESPDRVNQPTLPVELPSATPTQPSPYHARTGSGDHYYEDVDPRFVSPEALNPSAELPASLTAGPEPVHSAYHAQSPSEQAQHGIEDMGDGTRSPASDMSHFTSVSQRGVNPNWQPPLPNPPANAPSHRRLPHPRAQQQRQQPRDVLTGNNDFELPGVGRSRGDSNARAPGMIPSMAPAATAAGGGGGRYPAPKDV